MTDPTYPSSNGDTSVATNGDRPHATLRLVDGTEAAEVPVVAWDERAVVESLPRDSERAAELDSIVRLIASELGADASMLAVNDGTPGEPHVYSSWGLPVGPTVLHGVAGGGAIGHALARNQPIVRRLRVAESYTGSARIVEVVVVPVESPRGMRGALCVGYGTVLEENTEALIAELSSYAAVIGLWLGDSQALMRLLRAADEDGLTGCLTYPGMISELDNEAKRSRRTRQPLSCLFIDVDHFKAINDEHGHLNGNKVLAQIGETLCGRVRETDTVSRFGGDEFVILMPDTGTLAASQVSTALQEAVHASTAKLPGGPVTISIGVGELSAGMTPLELVGGADRSLRERRARGDRDLGR